MKTCYVDTETKSIADLVRPGVLACEYEDGSELLYSKNQTQCIAQGDYLVTKSNETAKAATLTYTWLFIDRVEVAIVEK